MTDEQWIRLAVKNAEAQRGQRARSAVARRIGKLVHAVTHRS
jgi:hypothetical protein